MVDLRPPQQSDLGSRSLLDSSRSTPLTLQLGTGASIYTGILIPAILSAKHEIILVTCFWAPSKTLSALHNALERLAATRLSLLNRGHPLPTLLVSICLSSRSLLQKLLHTSSPEGYLYPPSSWPKKLGLPTQEVLEAGGISLTVKSLFFLPFSVMHPKFLIVDRQRAFVPSCNISWEAWLEGCVEIRGPALRDLLIFYSGTWDKALDVHKQFPHALDDVNGEGSLSNTETNRVATTVHYIHAFPADQAEIRTLILPSSQHRNPHFHPFPWQSAPQVPSTPLNLALLQLFDEAVDSIYVQTPNLTSAPVISTLLAALQRGVHVAIVTSRNMMLLEQLVTAGTTTGWCIRSMVRRYKSMCSASAAATRPEARGNGEDQDLEIQDPHPGMLRISYFHSRQGGTSRRQQQQQADLEAQAITVAEEPVHSHLKLTIVDGRYTVLGSGNMDRASWYTSQELGILFDSADFAFATKGAVDQVLDGRLELVFGSEPA